jgi:hypothetical protein
MDKFIKEIGNKTLNKVLEFWKIKIRMYTTEIFIRIKNKVKELWSLQMVINMKVPGNLILFTVWAVSKNPTA